MHGLAGCVLTMESVTMAFARWVSTCMCAALVEAGGIVAVRDISSRGDWKEITLGVRAVSILISTSYEGGLGNSSRFSHCFTTLCLLGVRWGSGEGLFLSRGIHLSSPGGGWGDGMVEVA